MNTEKLLWAGTDERDGLFNGRTHFVIKDGDHQHYVRVRSDLYEEGVFAGAFHLEVDEEGTTGWVQHPQGGTMTEIHADDFSAWLEANPSLKAS